MESQETAADGLEKSKARVSRWVVGGVLVFVVVMFVLSATPFGLAVWLGSRDDNQQMSLRIQQAPLHREVGALAGVFQVPAFPREVYWREVSMLRPLKPAGREDKALWAVLRYEEAPFGALLAQWPSGEAADVGSFLPWLLEDVEKNMHLRLSAEVEVVKLPSELFASKAVPPKSLSAYVIPSQQSVLLMRYGEK